MIEGKHFKARLFSAKELQMIAGNSNINSLFDTEYRFSGKLLNENGDMTGMLISAVGVSALNFFRLKSGEVYFVEPKKEADFNSMAGEFISYYVSKRHKAFRFSISDLQRIEEG